MSMINSPQKIKNMSFTKVVFMTELLFGSFSHQGQWPKIYHLL